jgi:hypothetical protein
MRTQIQVSGGGHHVTVLGHKKTPILPVRYIEHRGGSRDIGIFTSRRLSPLLSFPPCTHPPDVACSPCPNRRTPLHPSIPPSFPPPSLPLPPPSILPPLPALILYRIIHIYKKSISWKSRMSAGSGRATTSSARPDAPV